MDVQQFYNRTQETEKMVDLVNLSTKNNKIIIISGKTGVGKSAFVEKVLSHELSNYLSIRVNICKASAVTIENLHYINALYRTLSDLANKELFDGICNPLQQGISSIKNLFSFGVDVLREKTVGEGNTLFERSEERSVIRKKDYIISILQTNQFIVDIENIQNIDVQSFEVFKDVVDQISNTTFIFEYTTENDTLSDELLSFFNTLKKFNAFIYLFEMKDLDYSEAKKLAPRGLSEHQVQELYQRSNGNLVKIQLADSVLSGDDPIAVKLDKLSKDKRFLVNLLYLNESSICYADLFQMLVGNINAPPFSEQKLVACINELESEKLIRILNDGRIRIYHDSIIVHLNTQSASALLYTAYGVLKEYYNQLLLMSQSDEAVEHLFYLYLRFSDEELLTILPQIAKIIRNYNYPYTAISKLITYREKVQISGQLNPKLFVKLVTLLAKLCLEYGLYGEALSNLDLIYLPTNPYHRAMRAAALALDFSNDVSIKSIYGLIRQAASPRERITSELCLLSAEMARQPRKKSLEMAQKMMLNPEYYDCFEYAFLLSNYAELVDDKQECIRLYKQAIQRFHSAARDDLAANILVFLSMMYAYDGKISDARRVLDYAKTLGGVREAYLLNNHAVLYILEGKAGAKSAKQLSDSLLLTCDPYEKILIHCNLLVCYTILGQVDRAKQVMLEITSQPYEQFRYEEFLHIVYQDLLYYSKAVNNASDVEYYRQKLHKLIENGQSGSMYIPIAKMQLENRSSLNVFFSRFPFRVDFLGRWNIEVSPDLENF